MNPEAFSFGYKGRWNMSELIIGLLLAVVLFFIGSMTQAWKKLVQTFTDFACKIFPFLEKQMKREKQLKLTDEFKGEYSMIREIRRSNIGMKKKKVITVIYFLITTISLGLVIGNLKYWTGTNIITDWISEGVSKVSWLSWLDVGTTYTAIVFSLLSFSLTSLLRIWKEGKEQRKEKKAKKRKEKVLKTMTSSELTQIAVEKTEEEKQKSNSTKINLE